MTSLMNHKTEHKTLTRSKRPIKNNNAISKMHQNLVSAFRVSQATRATFPNLYFRSTFLFFIENGSKKISGPDGKELIGQKNDLLVCTAGPMFTVQNNPLSDSQYQALCISFDDKLIHRVFNHQKNDLLTPAVQLVSSKDHPNQAILSIALETLEKQASLPPEILENRLIEPLIWLKTPRLLPPT